MPRVVRPRVTHPRAGVPEADSIKYRSLDVALESIRVQWFKNAGKLGLQDLKYWIITRSLKQNAGNVAQCAEDLGVSQRTLMYYLHVMGVKVPVAAHERTVWLEELNKTQIVMPKVPQRKRGPKHKNNPVK